MLGNLKLGMQDLCMGFIRILKKQILSVCTPFPLQHWLHGIYVIKFKFITGTDCLIKLFFLYFPPLLCLGPKVDS